MNDPAFLAAQGGGDVSRPPLVSSGEGLDPARTPGWDGMLKAAGCESIFHGSAWASVLQATYGFKPVYLVKKSGDEIRALLPLMEVKSWLTGRRGVSLPFTDDCEPIGPETADIRELAEQALEMGRERGWKYLELRGGRRLFPDAPVSVAFYGHELDLSGGEEALMARMETSVRRAIRKAGKSELKIEATNSLESVKEFYRLLCRTRQRHGMPPQPFAFFEQIHRHVLSTNQGMVVLARLGGRAVAGAVYLTQGKRALYKFGASDERFQELRGNNLVMWHAIRSFAANGFASLNLGRSSKSNAGLRRFKLGWGAVESEIEYLKWDFAAGGFITDRDGAAGWHNKVFRVMPRGLARLAGAGLYRHWA